MNIWYAIFAAARCFALTVDISSVAVKISIFTGDGQRPSEGSFAATFQKNIWIFLAYGS